MVTHRCTMTASLRLRAAAPAALVGPEEAFAHDLATSPGEGPPAEFIASVTADAPRRAKAERLATVAMIEKVAEELATRSLRLKRDAEAGSPWDVWKDARLVYEPCGRVEVSRAYEETGNE